MRFLLTIFMTSLLYVPSVQAGELRAKATITRGTVITKDLVDGIEDPEALGRIVGKQATRTIYADTPLTLSMVTERDMVQRNQTVIIFYKLNNMVMENQGRALSAGSYGKEIKVLTEGSRKVLTAKVVEYGRVEVCR